MSSEMETYEVEGGVNEEGHYEALSKQPMSFHDALAELIDNSISASIREESYINQDNPDGNFRIQITINRSGNKVDVTVADSGSGMEPDVLAEHVLTSGDNHGDGVLNEHGMGLKNALCVLTKNEGDPPFSIITKKAASDRHALYEGPLGGDKQVLVDDYTALWNEGTDYLTDPKKGTRVHFTSEFSKFNSIYPRAGSLETIVKALREHLGVFYRHFLEYDQNHIKIKWNDKDRDSSRGNLDVHPVFPEFVENDPKPVSEELDGVVGNVEYHRGAINWEKTRKKYENLGFDIVGTTEDESPFRIYYRKNKSTQGVNVVYNGRTIDTGAIERIWDSAIGFGEKQDEDHGTIAAHSRYNDFAGEVIITDSRFETVNNKIGMNPDSERWQGVKTNSTHTKGIIQSNEGKSREKTHMRHV